MSPVARLGRIGEGELGPARQDDHAAGGCGAGQEPAAAQGPTRRVGVDVIGDGDPGGAAKERS